MDLPETTECPYYLISRASLAVTTLLKRHLHDAGVHDVRPSYLGVLVSLWHDDGVKTVELARRAGLEPSTMTGLLDRMERDHLLRRTPDPDDRRAHRILLTERGRNLRDPILRVVNATLDGVLAGLSPEAIETTKATLRHILGNTDKAGVL